MVAGKVGSLSFESYYLIVIIIINLLPPFFQRLILTDFSLNHGVLTQSIKHL